MIVATAISTPDNRGRLVLIADAPHPVRPLDQGATCPWQDGHGRCTALPPLFAEATTTRTMFEGMAKPMP